METSSSIGFEEFGMSPSRQYSTEPLQNERRSFQERAAEGAISPVTSPTTTSLHLADALNSEISILDLSDAIIPLRQLREQPYLYFLNLIKVYRQGSVVIPNATTQHFLEGEQPCSYLHFPNRAKFYRRDSVVIPNAIAQHWLQLRGLGERPYLYLLKLAKKEAGWSGPGSRPLQSRSLSGFLELWENIKAKAHSPEFSLLPNGNLQAEWYRDDHHLTELEFRADGLIFFGFFDGEIEIEGAAGKKEILSLVESSNYKYLQWKMRG